MGRKAFTDCIHWKGKDFPGCIKGLCVPGMCSKYAPMLKESGRVGMLKVMVKEPMQKPVIKEIGKEHTDIYPEIHCDCFDIVAIGNGVIFYCDDEGRLKPNVLNLVFHGMPIMGTVLFAGTNDEGETLSLTDSQVAFIMESCKIISGRQCIWML